MRMSAFSSKININYPSVISQSLVGTHSRWVVANQKVAQVIKIVEETGETRGEEMEED